MAKLEERTEHGWLSAVGVDQALLRAASALASEACTRGELRGERTALKGRVAYFKKGPLRGGSRLRHALRMHLRSVPPPRVREHDNLCWLREHGFGAPLPLAAGSFRRGAMPHFQFLFTELVPDAVALESYLSGADEADRGRALCTIASAAARMHALGFIHHDLYPRNILIRPERGEPRAIFLDAWAGGPGCRSRGPAYDLACFFLYAPETLRPDEPRRFLEIYGEDRAHHGRAPDPDRLRRAIERERARLVGRLSRRARELRGRPLPDPTWSLSA